MTRPVLAALATAVLLPMTAFFAFADDAKPRARETTRLLTDFTDATRDFGWFVVNDGVMGGRSSGGFEREGDGIRFAGRTNTRGGGFSSIRTRPVRLDLSEWDGISIRTRADGRTYTFILRTNARYRGMPISYHADFKTRDGNWVEARVPFSAFKPQFRGMKLRGPKLDASRIEGLGLMIYDKRDGPFEARFDKIGAYSEPQAFRLSDYRWKRRLLVIAAPKMDDKRLDQQIAQLNKTREAFEARDMTLIVLLEGEGSFAGQERLDKDNAARLRRRLDIGAGAFEVLLLGKDGQIKRTASKVDDMQAIYKLVDSMPMRQSEMRDRGS